MRVKKLQMVASLGSNQLVSHLIEVETTKEQFDQETQRLMDNIANHESALNTHLNSIVPEKVDAVPSSGGEAEGLLEEIHDESGGEPELS